MSKAGKYPLSMHFLSTSGFSIGPPTDERPNLSDFLTRLVKTRRTLRPIHELVKASSSMTKRQGSNPSQPENSDMTGSVGILCFPLKFCFGFKN